MSFFKNLWPTVKRFVAEKASKSKDFVLSHKKATIISVLTMATLVFGSLLTYNYYNSNVHTLYHVSLNDKDIGVVSDPEVVHDWLNNLLTQKKKDYPSLNLKIDDQIEFEAEEVYNGRSDDKKVLNQLKDKITIKTEAVKIVVNGEVIGYIKDEKTFEQILDSIQSSYTNSIKKDVKLVKSASYQQNDNDDSSSPSVEIIEAKIKEKVNTNKEEVSPDRVMSTEEIQLLLEKGAVEQKKYAVQSGDCLGCIASKFDMSSSDLKALNPGITEDTILQIGQELVVSGYEPKIHVETTERLIQEESIDYEIETREDSSLFAGERKTIQKGEEGKKKVTYKIIKENGVELEREKLDEEIISEPVTKIIAVGTKIVPNRGSGRFQWPTNGGRVTSGFGYRWGSMHTGIDISGVSNRTIMAADAGSVEFAGWKGGYGNCIIINHNNGFKTLYGHLSSISVSTGQKVGKGQAIGVMGTTGYSTGVHLHFEVIRNGSKENPLQYLR